MLYFILMDSLNHQSRSISSDTKCCYANCKVATVSSFREVLSLHPNKSIEHWMNHMVMYFLECMHVLVGVSPTTISMPKTVLLSHDFLRNREYVLCSFVLLVSSVV